MSIFYSFSALRGLAMGIFSPIWILYLISIDYDFLQIGLMGAVLEIAKLIFEVPSGVFADRYGIKISIASSFFFSILTWAFFPFIDSAAICILAMIIWALSDSLISGSFETWMSRVAGEDRFGKEMMKNTQLLITFLIIGSIASGYLYSLNIYFPFLLVMVIYLLLFIWMSVFIKVPSVSETNHGDQNQHDSIKIIKESLKIILNKKRVLLIVIAGFFTATAYDTISRYWQPFLSDLGFSEKSLGYIFALGGFTALVLLTLTIRFEKKIEKNPYLALTSLDSMGMVMTFLLSRAFRPLGIPCTAFLLAIEDIHHPIVTSYLNKFFPDSYKNTLFSLNSGVGAIGEILSGVIFGIISAAFGLSAMFVVVAVFLLIPIILYTIVPKIKDNDMKVQIEKSQQV
ncbi:MFS transporter [Bacillus sp. 0102A]|uniref:MFS transporter n=1 Tax=Bacillus sp. 0102A TaxID=3120563 RepID=UPI002FD96BB3